MYNCKEVEYFNVSSTLHCKSISMKQIFHTILEVQKRIQVCEILYRTHGRVFDFTFQGNTMFGIYAPQQFLIVNIFHGIFCRPRQIGQFTTLISFMEERRDILRSALDTVGQFTNSRTAPRSYMYFIVCFSQLAYIYNAFLR